MKHEELMSHYVVFSVAWKQKKGKNIDFETERKPDSNFCPFFFTLPWERRNERGSLSKQDKMFFALFSPPASRSRSGKVVLVVFVLVTLYIGVLLGPYSFKSSLRWSIQVHLLLLVSPFPPAFCM